MKATNKKSFVYYLDWAEQTLALPSELRLKIDDAIKRYVLYGEEPKDREVLYSMFGLMRMQIDRDTLKWDKTCSVRSEAGKMGNEKRWGKKSQIVASIANATTKSQMSQGVASVADNVNDNVNDNDKVNVNTNKIRNKVACSIPFDDFWNLYGKKIDRVKCERKWLSLTDEQRNLAMKHVPRYISSSVGKELRFRKNPLSYLNGECWNDEILDEPNMNVGVILNGEKSRYDNEKEW